MDFNVNNFFFLISGLMAEDEDYPQGSRKRGRGGKKEGRGKKAHFVRFISQKELECAKNS